MANQDQGNGVRHLPLPPPEKPSSTVSQSSERPHVPVPFVEKGGVKVSLEGVELERLNLREIEGGGVSFNIDGLRDSPIPAGPETAEISFKNLGEGKILLELTDKPVDGNVFKQRAIIDFLSNLSEVKEWTEAAPDSKKAPVATVDSIQSEMHKLEERKQELQEQQRDLRETELTQERNEILSEITGKKGWSVGEADSQLGIIRSKETVGIYNPEGKCIGNVSADESLKRMTAETFQKKAEALINK